ncbi:hypothetical protein [Pseudomonas sp. R4-39-08]|uniref:hypothetical protein n=1 Tax=Pseudomonas sp. R4-39-08 TaxID=1173288 RepID=UPI000F582590|nr:hypothetical protein [Pseudomonas sp. R4-39-08]
MTLPKGDIIKLIDVGQAKVVLSDWLNSREVAPGDIAEVEDISMGEAGCIARLLCESHPGSLEWRASYILSGLTYEALRSYPNDVPS